MDLDNSVSLSESWMMNSSNVFLSNSQVEEEQAYMRISIGTFIGQRTGALGSLEGRAGREGTVRVSDIPLLSVSKNMLFPPQLFDISTSSSHIYINFVSLWVPEHVL